MTRQTAPSRTDPYLQAAIEASDFGILAFDAEGRIVLWNTWLAERTAVPEAQALGKRLSEALPGVPETTIDLCAEVLATGRPRLLSPSLHETPIPFTKPSHQAVRLHPVYDRRGRISGAVLIINDLSRTVEYERFAAEEAAAERREREGIFQAIGHPALILDRAHNIVAANRAAETITGRAQDELVGQKCYRVMHGADAPPPGCPFERMAANGRLEIEEMVLETLGRVFLVSCTPLLDGTGNLERVIHIATDITDRKRAEKELFQSQQILQGIIDGTPDAIYVKDLQGRYLTFNTGAEQMTGKSASEVIGKDDTCLFPPQEAAAVMAGDRRVVEAGRSLIYEETATLADGRVHSFLSTKGPLFDESGASFAFFGITHDITDRKKAEEALNARNEELAQLNHIALDLASIPAGHGLFRYITRRLKKLTDAATTTFALYHIDKQELRVEHAELDQGLITELFQALGGKKLTEATFPVSAETRRELIQNPVSIKRSLAEITFGVVPLWIGKLVQKAQGIDRFVGIAYVVDGELYGTSVLGLRAGQPDPPLEMLQSFVNLAAVSLRRMRVENALKLSEERYTAFLKQSSEAICLFEIDHAPIDAALATEAQIDLLYAQAVIAACNRIFAKSHGYEEPEQVSGFRIGQIFPRMARENLEYLRAFIENGHRISNVETKELARDGSIRYFLNSLIGHVEEGRLLRVWGAKQDISRIKQVEEEIRILNAELERRVAARTLQLETANKELDAFAYSVSHDLRAPLRAVDGFTQLLVEEFGPRLDAEGRRICAVISESARNMGRLIDDLLLFSRVVRTEMNDFPIDMAALVETLFVQMTTPAERGRIDFRIGPLSQGHGDPALIRQAWTNLLANAVKFSSSRERAVIEVGCLPEARRLNAAGNDQQTAAPDSEAVYFIRDNGAGFDMAYAGKLFGVFQRLHSTKEFDGTGVGLAIVQRIIHRHGGRIWAEGKPGQGATFYFTLGTRPHPDQRPDGEAEKETGAP